MSAREDITRLLNASRNDADAADRLYDLVYAELCGIAGNQLRAERSDHTLQATALANEVYLKLAGQEQAAWRNRAQFFAIAARAARRLLVDHARARLRLKRGAGAPHTSLTRGERQAAASVDTELVALDEALSRLQEEDALKHRIVEMRHFGGLTNDEIAQALGVSTRTVERHWRYARAWLYRALHGDPEDTATGD